MPMRTKLLRGLFISLLLLLVKKSFFYGPGCICQVNFFSSADIRLNFNQEKRGEIEKKSEYWIFILICWTWAKNTISFFCRTPQSLSLFLFNFFAKKRKKSFCTIFQVAVNQLETLLNEMEKYFLAQKDIRGNLSNASLKRKDKKWLKSLLIKSCFCLKVANAHLRGYM